MPWAGAAAGPAPIGIPPMLLVGPPAIGKSVWARRLAGQLGVPAMVVEATSDNAGFGITGLQSVWGSARRPCVGLDPAPPHRQPAGVLGRDREGTASSGSTFDLTAALLPLMEPVTACAWTCPFFRVGFDMSLISWILAANGLRDLSGPFLSRLRVVLLPLVSLADLYGFARREARRRGLSEANANAIATALNAAGPRVEALSLHSVLRMLDRAEGLERRPTLH
jgi:hypothetical protein